MGVGCASNKEVMGAVQKAAEKAKRDMISVHLNKYGTFPHTMTIRIGAAQACLIRLREAHHRAPLSDPSLFGSVFIIEDTRLGGPGLPLTGLTFFCMFGKVQFWYFQ